MTVFGAQVSWPTVLAVLELGYVVVMCAWIVLEKRSPVATLAWILALLALPGVGFVVYFFLGPRKIRKRRLRRLRAAQAIAKPTAPALALAPATSMVIAGELVNVGQRAANARLSVARELEILVDGTATYDAIVQAIEAAQHHVHVLYYIFEPDETGLRIRDALIARARAGVRVRVLLDAVGSARTRHRPRFLRPLRQAGAEIAYFNPPGIAQLVSRLLNFRNHRKIVVCDGRVGFTGGVNVTDEESPTVTKREAWRDTHLRLVGPCVAWLQVVFLEDWAYAHRAAFAANESGPYFPEDDATTGTPVQIIESGPDRDVEAIKVAYFSAINAAQRRVWVTSAYLVPDESMLFALEAAALRGVDVRILVPRDSDSATAAAAARSYYDELIRAGVQVYEYLPRMLHAKTMVVDDAVAVVGTANFDNRSFRLNFEVTALLFDAPTTNGLAAVFERDLEDARLVTAAARRHVGLGGRLFEGTARLLSPVL